MTDWSASWFESPCIDLRPSDEFIQNHITGTTSLPWERLHVAMHELPDKHQVLQLIGSSDQLAQAASFLAEKNYEVSRQIVSNSEFWSWAASKQLTESSCHTVPLWQANPYLSTEIECIESLTSGRKALDLACGAGRDAVFLASRGWDVTALDIKEDALNRCQSLATSSNTTITPIIGDVESSPEILGKDNYDLIVVMRYLHRPLLPKLADMLNPGGLICYSTFMVGCEKFGSPRNPNFLLEPGELKQVYSDLTCHIDEVHPLPDGRPVGRFLAQR